MDNISDRLNALPPDRRKLLELLLQQESTPELSLAPGIQNAPEAHSLPTTFPLTYGQYGVWSFSQLVPNSPLYNMLFALHLDGPLDITILERCLNELVRRQSALRITIQEIDGQPQQVTTPELRVALPLQDLSQIAEPAQSQTVQRLITEEVQRPFDLSSGPLIRATLFRLGSKSHVVLLVVHHIICDAWSRGVLFRELVQLYTAFVSGQASPLQELPLQYAQFTLQQQERLHTEKMARQIAYWKQQLAGIADIELPTDFPRAPGLSFRGARQTHIFPAPLLDSLKALSQKEGLTLFTILLAGFYIVLSRYTGQTDLAIRLPVANRDQEELEGLVGFFNNILLLRMKLTEITTFRDLLRQVREMTLDAYSHREAPFEKLMEELSVERRLGGSHLFQVMFNMPLSGNPRAQAGDLTLTLLEFESEMARLELSLVLDEIEAGLRATFTFNADLLTAATPARLLAYYQTLLEAVVTNPDQPFEMLPVLPNAPARPDAAQVRAFSSRPAYAAPRTATEKKLANIWSEALGVQPIGLLDNFFELGGDSLLSIRLVALAKQESLALTPRQIFQHPSLADLAASISTTHEFQAEQGLVTGLVPLTCDQYWYLYRAAPERIRPNRWNSSIFLQINPKLSGSGSGLEQAVQAIWEYHDALRARFIYQESSWQQVIMAPEEMNPFSQIDLATRNDDEIPAAIQAEVERLQNSLDLTNGPLFRVVVFNLGTHRPGRLLILAHHLVMDGFSLGIFLKDLLECYQQLTQHQPIQLPPKTVSVRQWAEWLHQYAKSDAVYAELDYWLNLPWADVRPLPFDNPDGYASRDVQTQQAVKITLTPEETTLLLRDVPTFYHTTPQHILLMALTQTITHWTGGQAIEVTCPITGRDILPEMEHIDLSRTVGWLALSNVLVLQRTESRDPRQALQSIEAQLQRVPNRGCGYHFLSDLRGDAELARKLKPLRRDELMFNYMGQMQAGIPETPWLSPAPEYPGHAQDPREKPFNVLYVMGNIVESQISLTWTYSPHVHHAETITQLAKFFKETLQALITS